MSKDPKLNKTLSLLDKEILKIENEYRKIYETVLAKHKRLEALHEDFPVKFIKDEKYEDLVLQAANYKHQTIQLMREATAIAGNCKADYEYLEGQLKLYSADTFLREKFDKVTDSLRNSFVKSKKPVRNILKILKGVEAIQNASEKLVRAFEMDEVNFRRFHAIQNVGGL